MKPWIPGLLLFLALASPAQAIESALLEEAGIDLYGSFDLRMGTRLQQDAHQRRSSLQEGRLQLEASRMGEVANLSLRGDLVFDRIAKHQSLELERGKGFIDLREANVQLFPHPQADLKIGRQILTWGTGDLLFINDLFPKDWQAFFLGRDEEYLKAPSDAAMLSIFPGDFALDLIYSPRFDSDRHISGERISFFSPATASLSGRDNPVQVNERDRWFSEDEIALRLSRNLSGLELALYGYDGYWKSPAGMTDSGQAFAPGLQVLGASLRVALGEGLFNMELGRYDSKQDSDGSNPLIPNSEQRLLLGYERELATDLSAGLQYYLERMEDYGSYRSNLPAGFAARDENRQVVSLRLTQMLMNQNLTLSLFVYASPSDQDAYLRPAISYRASDHLELFAGGNLFTGKDNHTFFGQFEDNSNLYAGFRHSF